MNFLPYVPDSICKVASGNIPNGEFMETSLLFADVSGFTAMSEKLAVIGKEGAEELTAILNNYFTRMISIVSSLDGDIIVFGGDAMLIAFNSTANAVECAIQMQTTMEEFKNISSSAGDQTLRMSIGISSGKAFLAALGSKEGAGYGMFGRCVNRVGEVEAVASAGEICFDRVTLEKLDLETFSTEIETEIYKLEKTPTIELKETKNKKEIDSFDPSPFIHPGLRSRLEGGFDSGEHRKVTVMFMNFRDVNPVLENSKDKIISILNTFFLDCFNIIKRYDGFLCKIDVDKVGCKMMVIFGAPQSHENDIERAFHTALDINELDSPFELRTGINTGFVYAGFVGAPSRKEYTVMGDAVNIAARLMASSPAGNIYVRDQIEGFCLTPLEPIKVKGKSEPLELFKLNEINSEDKQHTERERKEIPFTARKREQEIIFDAFKSVQIKQGKTVFIHGEAGIGKSRLFRETASSLREDAIIMKTECLSHTNMDKYWCWKNLFGMAKSSPDEISEFISRTDRSLLEWLPVLGDFFGVEIEESAETRILDPDSRKRILFDAVTQILVKMSSERSLLIAIDSVQWLDELSLQLIRHLSSNLSSERVLLLLSGRTADIQGAVDVELQAFSEDELKELTSSILNCTSISKDVIDVLYNKSKGNPLFLIEVLKSLREENWIFFDEHFNEYQLNLEYSSTDTPDSLRGIIMAGVDRLSEQARKTLQLSSVIGSDFDKSILDDISPELSVDFVNELLARDLLAFGSDNIISFPQPVIQETVYDSISFSEKRKYHYTIGTYIERKNAASIKSYYHVLAWHFYNSTDQEKALLYLESAGEKARDEADSYLALDCYKKILLLSEASVDQKGYSNLYLGNIYSRLGELDKSEQHYNEGCELNLGDLNAQFNFRLGELFRKKGKLDEAESYFIKVSEGDSYADAMASTGLLKAMQGDFEKALPLLESAEKLFLAENKQKGLAYCINNIAQIARLQGDTKLAIEHMERALSVFEELEDISGESSVLENIGAIHNDLCNYDKAISCYEKALHLCERVRDHLRTCTILTSLGAVFLEKGESSEAKSSLVRALKIAGKMDNADSKALALLNLARIQFEEGEVGLSLSSLKDAMEQTERSGNLLYQVFVRIRYSEILLEIGDNNSVREHLEEMEKVISKYNIRQCQSYLHLFRGMTELYSDREKASEDLDKALELSEELGQKSETVRTLLALSKLNRVYDRSKAASENLNRAIEIALEIKSEPLLQECSLEQVSSGYEEPFLISLSGTENIHIRSGYYQSLAEQFLKKGEKAKAEKSSQTALKNVMSIAASIDDPLLQGAYLSDPRREKLRELIGKIKEL